MHILLHGVWFVKQMQAYADGGVGFEERMADSRWRMMRNETGLCEECAADGF